MDNLDSTIAVIGRKLTEEMVKAMLEDGVSKQKELLEKKIEEGEKPGYEDFKQMFDSSIGRAIQKGFIQGLSFALLCAGNARDGMLEEENYHASSKVVAKDNNPH